MTATATPQDTPKAAVFLSYSRTDGTFRERLAAALEARGYAPIYDQSERIQDDPDLRLTAQDEWWRSLKAMIAASDVMIFVVTPDSATSPVCDDEIAHARVLGKRVIAILRRAVDFNVAPERLRALNVKIDFRNDADHAFYAALASLCAELDLDIEWHRLGTHLTRQANRWEQSGRPEAQLLRAGAIAEAESWAARRPQSVHELGRTLLDFLDASRAKESADRERLLTVTGLGFIKSAELAVSEGLFDSALRIAAAGVIASEDWLLKRVAERLESTTEAMRRNKLVRILAPNTQRSRHIAFNAQGELLVLGYQNGTLWDSASGIQIGTIESSDEIFSIEVCPIGDLIVTGHRSGLVRVWRRSWDSARPYQVIAELAAHRAPVAQAVFHADGRSIGTASWDGTAGLWVSRSVDRLEWRLSATTTSEDIVLEALSVALHPHEARFVVSKGAHLERWRVEHGRVVCDEGWSIEGHNRKVWHVEYNPDGTHLVTASEDGSARIWDAASGALNHDLKHGAWVRQARYSPNGKHLITCATDGIIRTWDAESGSELNRYNGHASPVIGVAFNRSGSHLASVSEDSRVRLWKCETDGPLWTTPRQPTSLNDACFSPDGSRIAIALGMRAWNETDYLAKIFTPAAPDGVVTCDGHRAVFERYESKWDSQPA
jgi:WD40 repeat protein